MKVKRNLSSLVSIPQMESDQEGMLVGGFTMLSSTEVTPTIPSNGNCSCNPVTVSCSGNDNCSCNTGCSRNDNCNCDCGTTTTSAPKVDVPTTTPTGMTGFVWGV